MFKCVLLMCFLIHLLGDSFIPGALVLAFSLKKHLKHPVDYIVLVSSDVTLAARLTLSKLYGSLYTFSFISYEFVQIM